MNQHDRDSAELRRLCAERDRLQEALKDADAGMMLFLEQRDQLKAENETLRQDAARWKFVRSPVGTNSPFAVWHEGKMPVFSSIADRMVDDAMAKEASHE
ncbi:MAG TPA: hypothetical protein DCR78_08870 [Pseudomonas sp.]|nr:hypothetical protein [Pseudomonas sp.]|tara:strand:- start:602 stop:901 length:300 start_codon:yes stop_codon:yes gene_type:complete